MGLMRLTLPRLGETMEEARVTGWLKAPGERFRRGDVLMEVETDKTVVEVPALTAGTLVARLVGEGDRVELDQPFAEVEVEAATGAPTPPEAAAPPLVVPASPAAGADLRPASSPAPAAGLDRDDPARRAASPRARRLARVAGVELGGVAGTGRRGRITGADVERRRAALAGQDGPVAMRVVRSDTGARVPVLLLHGLFDEGRGWRGLPERLARAGHDVLVPDLPGHGASAPAGSLAEAADRLAEALARALPDGRLRLVGHSAGAVLAARLAETLGARAESLVLIAPAGLGHRINADFLDGMAHAETPAALGRAMDLLGGGPLSAKMLGAELARLRALRPVLLPLMRELAIGGMQQADIAPLLSRLDLPVRAIFGLQDRVIDWQDCANLPPLAACHLLRGAGHVPHVSAPDLTARLVTGSEVNEDRPVGTQGLRPPEGDDWNTKAERL